MRVCRHLRVEIVQRLRGVDLLDRRAPPWDRDAGHEVLQLIVVVRVVYPPCPLLDRIQEAEIFAAEVVPSQQLARRKRQLLLRLWREIIRVLSTYVVLARALLVARDHQAPVFQRRNLLHGGRRRKDGGGDGPVLATASGGRGRRRRRLPRGEQARVRIGAHAHRAEERAARAL